MFMIIFIAAFFLDNIQFRPHYEKISFFWEQTRDFPTFLKLTVEFGKRAFGPSKLGKLDAELPFYFD